MKYSILVTAYDPDKKLTQMTDECIKSIEENSVGRDYELIVLRDHLGLFSAYNVLFNKAKGDYLVVVPNDTVIMSPDWLEQLAIPDVITSWHIGTFLLTGHKEPDGGVTCYPRTIVNKVGLYDEQFDQGYGFGDNDWFHRAHLLNIEIRAVSVKLKHNGNTTYMSYWPEKKQAMYKLCEKLFKDKWQIK
jgi:hypothetical protein